MPNGEQQVLDPAAGDPAGNPSDPENPNDGGRGGDAPTVESLQQKLADATQREESARLRLLDPDYQDYLAERRGRGRAPAQPAEPKAPKDPLEGLTEEKLGAMSNRELLATAIERSVELISSKLKEEFLPEVESRLSTLGDTVADQTAKRDVAEAAAKHPDFWSYKAEMVALSVNPRYEGLPAEDLYVLAKAQKSGFAAPAATGTGTPAQRRAASAHTEKPGGTGGGGAGSGKNKSGEMEAGEAAEDAWNKVFGKPKA
jgi:hypothetical protein